MKTLKIRDNCVGFAGQHEFKTRQAGNGGERVLMGCRSDAKRCIWETRSRVHAFKTARSVVGIPGTWA